jgi:predicted nucleotidyltransferase
VLDLTNIDLDDLAEALEDHSYEHGWWLDPGTGEVVLWSDSFKEQGEPHPETRGLRAIDPIPSHEGYGDMQDFIERVRDPQARNLLELAIAGRGAFRRFKDTLLDFPELREAWFRFHDARVERRAISWLVDEGLVDDAAAERAIAERPDPELPELSGPFDPHEIARDVARELRRLYGERLRSVLLFGSWARGDAHPESDIDLLVVLDRVDSVWDELRRMEPTLWRHSFDNDTVVTALPVAERDVEERKRPVLVRAQAEGLLVG